MCNRALGTRECSWVPTHRKVRMSTCSSRPNRPRSTLIFSLPCIGKKNGGQVVSNARRTWRKQESLVVVSQRPEAQPALRKESPPLSTIHLRLHVHEFHLTSRHLVKCVHSCCLLSPNISHLITVIIPVNRPVTGVSVCVLTCLFINT